MNLPDELMDELTDAWKRGDRSRANEVMWDVFEISRADKERAVLGALLDNPLTLARVFDEDQLGLAIHAFISEELAGESLPHRLSCHLQPEDFDCELIGRILMYKVRALGVIERFAVNV